jgi:ATP-dependent protease ClpP protease subunit
MSMGSVILQAADKRTMTKNSLIMIHYGYGGMNAHQKTSHKWNGWERRSDVWMENMYLDKIGDRTITVESYFKLIDKMHEIPKGNAKNRKMKIGRKEIEAMLNFDTIIDAETALALNLIDAIEG